MYIGVYLKEMHFIYFLYSGLFLIILNENELIYIVTFEIISPQQAVGRDKLSEPAGQWVKSKHKTKLDVGACGNSKKDLRRKKNTPDQGYLHS